MRTTTSPEMSARRASTTLSDSLSATSWPRSMSSSSTSGCTETAHLAAGGEDVDGAVVVGAEVGAVGRRRHRELLDLLAQRRDVLAGLAEGGREALVLGDGLGELALGLEHPLLERADPLRGVLEPAAEDRDLLLEASGAAPGGRRPGARTRRDAGHAPMPRVPTSSPAAPGPRKSWVGATLHRHLRDSVDTSDDGSVNRSRPHGDSVARRVTVPRVRPRISNGLA